MTLDCTNLKPGDKVRLRNGEIDIVTENDGLNVPIRLKKHNCWHHLNGRYRYDLKSEDDIVEILTNPEPEMDTTSLPSIIKSGIVFCKVYSNGTLDLKDYTFRDPAKITINGKEYVPARDPNLCHPLPHKHTYTVSATTNEVVAITCDGKRFTPADSWPEPITNRAPTEEDGDKYGEVQVLDKDGNWKRYCWDEAALNRNVHLSPNWAKTSDWKPRPIDKKTLTLRDLREAMRAGESPDHDTLQSAIELLEATP